MTVGLNYDPMLAKLIVWGATREEAVARMHRALREFTIVGVETSREFHLRVMEDAEFQRGDIEIQWLERRLPSLTGAVAPADHRRAAAIAAALLADRDRQRRTNGAAAPAGAERSSALGSASTGSDAWKDAARREGVR
jgi:acetyl-CoA carboxylase biotin carboxylase subunit